LNGKRENKEREGGLTSGVAISSFFCAGVSRMHAQKKKKTDVVDFWRENGRESKAEEERGLSLVF